MAHLFDSQKTQREEKTSGKGERKGRKEGSHTLPSAPSVLAKTKRGRIGRKKEGGRRQERRRKEGGMWGRKRWRNSPFIE